MSENCGSLLPGRANEVAQGMDRIVQTGSTHMTSEAEKVGRVQEPKSSSSSMRDTLLAVAAAGEAVAGLLLFIAPTIVARLLFGGELSGTGIAMSHVAGIALFALGAACWPIADARAATVPALPALLAYSFLIAVYFAFLSINHEHSGRLPLPGLVLHAVLTIFLAREWLKALSKPENGRNSR
jgi:hypothetical protein